MVWWLNVCAALLERTQVLFSAPMLDCLHTPITLVLGDLMSSSGLGHLHTYVHAHVCIIKTSLKSITFNQCMISLGVVSRQGFSVDLAGFY